MGYRRQDAPRLSMNSVLRYVGIQERRHAFLAGEQVLHQGGLQPPEFFQLIAT